jgi:hypothetical protein
MAMHTESPHRSMSSIHRLWEDGLLVDRRSVLEWLRLTLARYGNASLPAVVSTQDTIGLVRDVQSSWWSGDDTTFTLQLGSVREAMDQSQRCPSGHPWVPIIAAETAEPRWDRWDQRCTNRLGLGLGDPGSGDTNPYTAWSFPGCVAPDLTRSSRTIISTVWLCLWVCYNVTSLVVPVWTHHRIHALLQGVLLVYAVSMSRLLAPAEWFLWTLRGSTFILLAGAMLLGGRYCFRPNTLMVCSVATFTRAEFVLFVNVVVLLALFGFSSC